MTCSYCKLPEKLNETEFVFVWPPQGHTLYKIANDLGDRNLAFENRIEDNCIVVETGDTARFVVTLSGLLTDYEAQDTRILVAHSREPSLADFGSVSSLRDMMGRVRSDWLIDLLRDERYVSYAQPIVAAKHGRPVLGHEFLFRGMDENGKTIPPDMLFESAHDPRVFFNLDRTARISAVETAARLDSDADVFINFMPGSVYDPAVCLRTTVQAALENDLKPERVVFEIVESQRIDDLAHLRGIVNFYRAAGFRIALDDFGAGHSNIEALIALKPDFVKLDKSMTSNLTETDERLAVVKALIGTFKSAGIQTIAEGIETEENAQVVIDFGIDRMQGYYFGRPAPVGERNTAIA